MIMSVGNDRKSVWVKMQLGEKALHQRETDQRSVFSGRDRIFGDGRRMCE